MDNITTRDLFHYFISKKGMDKQQNQEQNRAIDMMSIQRVAKKLNFGSYEEKEMAAKEIKRLAIDDGCVKRTMAELGIMQSLIGMLTNNLDGDGLSGSISAIEALIELARGTFR
jgi:hypothetical protein